MAAAGAGRPQDRRRYQNRKEYTYWNSIPITPSTPPPIEEFQDNISQDMYYDFHKCHSSSLGKYNNGNVERLSWAITFNNNESISNVKAFISKKGGINKFVDALYISGYYFARKIRYDGINLRTKDDWKWFIMSDKVGVMFQLIRHKSKRDTMRLSVNTELVYKRNGIYSREYITIAKIFEPFEDSRVLQFTKMHLNDTLSIFVNEYFVKKVKMLRKKYSYRDIIRMSIIKHRFAARAQMGLGM
jgi:hypothetical protein